MKFVLFILIAVIFIIFAFLSIASAQSEDEDLIMLETLHRMRLKQQNQENVVRAQIFKTVKQERDCTPVQRTRNRLSKIKNGSHDVENITINAGHEELSIDDNHGTINSDVNVQVIDNGDKAGCL